MSPPSAVRFSGNIKLSAAMESEINEILEYWLLSTDDLVEEFVKGSLRLY